MTESSEGAADAGPSHRLVEIGVGIATAIFGVIVIVGSVQAGIDWGFEGPKAGFFPFYIGVLILAASIANLIQIMAAGGETGTFASWAQLRQVTSVVVPTAVYVAIIPWIGIYVASTLLIGVFMKWIGRYGWLLVLLVSIGVSVVTFVVFERWFLVPLPKGPLEEFLGL